MYSVLSYVYVNISLISTYVFAHILLICGSYVISVKFHIYFEWDPGSYKVQPPGSIFNIGNKFLSVVDSWNNIVDM